MVLKQTGLTADLLKGLPKTKKGVKFNADHDDVQQHEAYVESEDSSRVNSENDIEQVENDLQEEAEGSETGTQVSTEDKIKKFKNANKTGYRALTEGLRKEQSVIEKNLLKAQTVVHFQNEEAYIAEQSLKESSNMQTLQLHKTRMLEERLARQREQRKEFEEYSIQQKLKSKEEQLKLNKLEHALQVLDFIKERKMLVMQKKEAFEDRMVHVVARQKRERRELADAQERTAKNLSMILQLEIEHMKPILKQRALAEHNLRQQQEIIVERKKAEQLREIQLLELKHKEKEFSLEIQCIEEIDEINIQQKADMLEKTSIQHTQLLQMKSKIQLAEFELQELTNQRRVELKMEEQAKKQRIEANRLKKAQEEAAVQRRKSMERQLAGEDVNDNADDNASEAQSFMSGSEVSDMMSMGSEISDFNDVEDNMDVAEVKGQDEEDHHDDAHYEKHDTFDKDVTHEVAAGETAEEEHAVAALTAEARAKVKELKSQFRKMYNEFKEDMKELKNDMKAKMQTMKTEHRGKKKDLIHANETELKTTKQEHMTDMSALVSSNEREFKTHCDMAEQEVRSFFEKQKLDAILHTVGDGIIAIDTRGIITTVNAAITKIFGFEEYELMGNSVTLIMDKKFGDHHQEYMDRYLNTGDPHIVGSTRCIPALRKDGTEIEIELSLSEVKNEDNHMFTGILRDVTERNRQAFLIELEQCKVEAILATCKDGIVVITPQGVIERVNKATLRMWAYGSEEELVGRKIETLMPEPHKSRHDSYLENYLTTGEAKVIGLGGRVAKGQKKDGTLFPVELQIEEIKMKGAHIFVGVVRDLTEIESEREKTIAEQEKIEVIFDTIPDAVICIDETGFIASVNVKTLEMFEYSKEEMIGQNITMLMMSPHKDNHHSYLNNYYTTGIKKVIGQERVVPAITKSKREITIQLFIKEIITPSGGKLFIGIVKDLSAKLDEEKIIALEADCAKVILDSARTPIIRITPDCIIEKVNSMTCELFGYEEGELVGQNVSMIVGGRHQAVHDRYVQNYLRTGEKKAIGKQTKVEGVKKDGSLILLELSIGEVKNENGHVFIAVIKDIDYERKIENIEDIQEEARHAIYNNVSDAVIVSDVNGTVKYTNTAVMQIFGLTPGDIIGKNVSVIMPPNVKSKHDSYLEHYQATGKKKLIDAGPRKVTALRKNGMSVNCSISLTEIFPNTEKHEIVAVIRDLTEISNMESMLKRRESSGRLK